MVAEGWNGPVSRVKEKALDVRVREGQYLMDLVVNNKEESKVKDYVVVLRNGRSMEATSMDGLVFNVKLANDKIKVYALNQLVSLTCITDMDAEDVVVNKDTIINEKEENMGLEIMHYLKEKINSQGGKEVVRYVVTDIWPEEVAAYNASKDSNTPVRTIKGDLLLAMKTGGWEFALLKNRLADKGRKFRLMIADHVTLSALGTTPAFMGNATFAWANASNAFFLKITDGVEWGLDDLGLFAFNTKKVSKRNQEIARITAHGLYSEDSSITMLEFKSNKDVKLYDGINFIRRSLATKMGFSKKVTRINFRLLTKDGVIKGDAIIVPDKWIQADVVYHGENLKGDLKTDGWQLATGFEHKPHHMAVWDDQSMIDNKDILSYEHQMRDITTLVANIREDLEAGRLPDWLMLGEDAHDEFGAPDMEMLSDRLHLNYVRLQAMGLPIQSAQHLLYMAINGILNRMQHSLKRDKMWLPLSNAFTGGVITWEALTEMGNIRLPHDKKGFVFFDSRYGVVIPGQRFIDTFDLHGTWDLDDTAKFILIKVWSSNSEITAIQRGGHVISEEMYIPKDEKDAVLCVAVIRSPNGPGEFSIEMIDEQSMMPMFHNLDMDSVTTIDLASRLVSLPQSTLLDMVTRTGMPAASVEYNKDALFSRDNAFTMIKAQSVNPGIGRMANIMMQWVNTLGPSFPETILDVFGNIVDSTRQGADIEEFKAIEAEEEKIFAQFVERCTNEDIDGIDSHLLRTRMRNIKMRKQLPEAKIARGRLAFVYDEYMKEMAAIRSEILNKSLQMRNGMPLVSQVRAIVCGEKVHKWAINFHSKNAGLLANVGKKLEASEEYRQLKGREDDRGREQARIFAELILNQAKAEETAEIVANMVKDVTSLGDEADLHMIGLYKYITTCTPQNKLGLQDRVIFQPGARGELNVMDLFIQALKNHSLI